MASGRATSSTVASAAAGAAGSSGTTTRPAPMMATRAQAYSTGSGQPDGHAGPGRQVGAVQAAFPGAGGMPQVGEGQLTRSPGILKVGGAAPVSRRRIDPLLNQRHAPFWW